MRALDLTEDKHIIHAQSIAATSDAIAEDLLEAYHSVHTSYVKTNPRSGLNALVWEKQAEHFVAEACMTCLVPAYPEAATHHLAQRVCMLWHEPAPVLTMKATTQRSIQVKR